MLHLNFSPKAPKYIGPTLLWRQHLYRGKNLIIGGGKEPFVTPYLHLFAIPYPPQQALLKGRFSFKQTSISMHRKDVHPFEPAKKKPEAPFCQSLMQLTQPIVVSLITILI
jgi:hypothetical protein